MGCNGRRAGGRAEWVNRGRLRGSRHVATRRSELGGIARNAELLDPAAQRTGIEAEDRGGAARAGDDPVGVPQDGDNVVALHGLQAGQGLARGWWGGRGGGSGALRPGSCFGGARLRRRGQQVGRDFQRRAGRQDDGALQHVFQLADVARPGVLLKPPHRPPADAVQALADPRRELVHQEVDEQRDVVLPLAQRRQADGEDVEAVVQVLAESFLLDLFEQVSVGGGDDADVHPDRGGAAHAVELALLEHAEQLHLGFRGQFADLVEEQRAAVGQLEPPLAPGDGAAEGALLVAEQLALDQAGGQGGAVDLDERLALARAGGVDGAGDQLLARARLAGDQHRGVGGGDAADLVEYRHQGGAAADDLLEVVLRLDLLLEVEVLLVEAGSFALRQDAVGDVYPEGTGGPDGPVRAAAGLHPDLDPRGAAVLAAQFQFPPGDRLTRQMLAPHFQNPGFPLRGVRTEGRGQGTDHLLQGTTQQFGRAAVRVEDPPVGADEPVGVGRVVKKVAIARLTLAKLLFGPNPLEF